MCSDLIDSMTKYVFMFLVFSVGLRMSSVGQGLEWPDAPVSGHPLNNNKCH